MVKANGKKFLSDLKLYSDYLKWIESENRYETWDEAMNDILSGHLEKYGDKIVPYINEILPSMCNKEFLASQRNLQFRPKQINKNNAKLYNCCVTYCYSPDVFNKAFYVLLCGTGLGISLKKKFVSQLPTIDRRGDDQVIYVVDDSIEGWADALKVLVSSFCKHESLWEEYYGKIVFFDYSNIRRKGSFISGGFRAPGPDGLQQSLDKIEKLLSNNIGEFKGIIAYDVFMHSADAVLSGGVRRSATNVVIDHDDTDMMYAKSGYWFINNPQRGRSNNSVALKRNSFLKSQFEELISINQGDNDLGFVFTSDEDEMQNPCFEISFCFYDKIQNKKYAAFQFCNLNEINASACIDSKGSFSEQKFYELCRNASILGTLQAGYFSFPYLGEETETIVKGEALLGVSITGWMMRPELFNAEILRNGANIVKDTNKEVASIIGINPAARTTTVKPSGNSSVILKTASGIHPEHSKRYFRIMQLNKDSDTARYLEESIPDLLEESRWSATKSDYVVYVPCENKGVEIMYKKDMHGIKHLELIKLVQQNWVVEGTNIDLCYNKSIRHNVSNTVIIDDMNEIIDYLYKEQDNFTAVSFLSDNGDKDYVQAPFTSVMNTEELVEKYGSGVIFMSGLIVDGLHIFNDNLWDAVEYVKDEGRKFTMDSDELISKKKSWIKRVKKFSKNYFKGDLDECIYCMKDVHLWHKWNRIMRSFKDVDFSSILTTPSYTDVNTTGAVACSGGSCEITF